jgi:prepilin signal peptidase PulO-like enzyme (type II secretory pathway)
MVYFYIFSGLILGAASGCFLNFLINRLPPRNLIGRARPYLFKEKKSQKYLAMIFGAILFAVVFYFNWPVSFSAFWWVKIVSQLIFTAALILIFAIDFKHYLILDKTIYPLLPCAFIFNWWLGGWTLESAFWLIVAALIGFIFYATQYYLSKGKWVGDADMKLGALLGLMLGWQGLLVALFIAYVGGSIVGLLLILFHKKKLSGQLPMATLLAPAAFISMLYSTQIIGWYFEKFIW